MLWYYLLVFSATRGHRNQSPLVSLQTPTHCCKQFSCLPNVFIFSYNKTHCVSCWGGNLCCISLLVCAVFTPGFPRQKKTGNAEWEIWNFVLIQGYMFHQLEQPPKINLVPEAARVRKQSWWMDGAHHRNGCKGTWPQCYQGDEITANKHSPACCHHHQPVVSYNLILHNILAFQTDIDIHYLRDLVSYWIKLVLTMSMFYLFS